jgi:PAS domain S-box-containing protein
MNATRKFWGTLGAMGIFIGTVLLLAFYFALRSTSQVEAMNRWVEHTEEVLGVIARARLEGAWLQTDYWAYRSSRSPDAPPRLQSDLKALQGQLERARVLTADNPAQQKILDQLVPEALKQAHSLEETMGRDTPKTGSSSAEPMLPSAYVSEPIRQLFDSLEANERALFASRSAAVQTKVHQARMVLILAAILTIALQCMGIHIISTEIRMRSEVEAGLREAQEWLRENAAALAASEDEQRKQNVLLRSILDTMAEGVAVADAEGHFTLFNPAAEKILGAGRADVPPEEWSKFYQVYRPDQITPFPSEELPLARALRGETADDVHMYIRHRQHSKLCCINVSGRPLIAGDGRLSGGVAVFHDITELLETNRELEAFSYSVSHDLQAPLRHMDGFSRILQQEYGPQLPEEARHYLDRVRSATTHMSNLVEDLLQLSRIGRQLPRLQRVALGALVEEARAETLSGAGDRTIDWKLEKLSEVEADANLMRQVLINLLSNAIKFTRNTPNPAIEIGMSKANGESIIFVRDNGAGFDPRYADKLFGVFQRLHRQDEFEGTGIGLALAQRIIHKHGGRIWAEAQPGQAATFYFTIPAGAAARTQNKEPVGASA